MTPSFRVLCIGLQPSDLGIGSEPLLPDLDLEIESAADAQMAKNFLLTPEHWDLLLCDASGFYDLGMDRRLAEYADRLHASVVLVRSAGSLLSPAEAAARGAADIVANGDREHCRMVVRRELAVAEMRKQLRQFQLRGPAGGKVRVSVPKISDFSQALPQAGSARALADGDAHSGVSAPGLGAGPQGKGADSGVASSAKAFDHAAVAALPELDDDAVKHHIESGGLTLEYQPIIPLHGPQEPHAMFEVLLRLRNDSGLLLPPRRFFPAVSRNRWMGRLDLWVFRVALPILARAQANKQIKTSFYINLAHDTLLEPGIARSLFAVIAGAEIAPGSLIVEIRRESLASPDTLKALADCLAEQGHTLLLEAFAPQDCKRIREYASWFKQVKLDVAVLEALEAGKVAEYEVQHTIRCVQNNGIKVIGLAVDNAPLLARLFGLGVDCIQGHFVSMPYAKLVYPDTFDIEVEPRIAS